MLVWKSCCELARPKQFWVIRAEEDEVSNGVDSQVRHGCTVRTVEQDALEL